MRTWSFPTLIIILAMLLLSTVSPAQEGIDYEKMNPNDFSLKLCPFDSAAAAMVLSDIGSTVFHYDEANGFFMLFERQVRVMIFKKEGYRYADWTIPLYHGRKSKESMSGFRARTYNLEGGKVVETKVKDESIFKEEVDSYTQNIRVTFPAVKEGSIVELKYTIRSTLFNHLRDWRFQYSIPMRWSEYTVTIPEFYEYATQMYGKVPFYINKFSTLQSSVKEGMARPIFYTDNSLHLATRDVPAIKTESFVNSMDNYTTRAEFVLRSYKFPNNPMVPINTTWRQVADDLLKDEDFGLPLADTALSDELATSVSKEAESPFNLMVAGFYRVQKTFKWNDHYSKYTSKNMEQMLIDKTGNSADINLFLVMLMRKLGLKADPVLLSTRDHGIVTEKAVSLTRMNHVICLVSLEGKDYLFDATSRWLPYTSLPFPCLNGKGMVVSADTVRWVNLLSGEKNQRYYLADLEISDEGEISGSMQISSTGYPGRNVRSVVFSSGLEEYVKTLKKDQKSWEISDVTVEGLDTLDAIVKVNYRLRSSDITQVSGDMIYLNTLANFGQMSNDFSEEKRSLPVDFGYPFRETYFFTFHLPKGYQVESSPSNTRLSLPGQAGSYKYLITTVENTLVVNVQLSVNTAIFYPSDYIDLHTFMIQAIAKQAQQIVLKKI